MKLFAEINGMGHTVVSITHDLNVASYARRIVRIVDGELTDSGETGANVEL